MRTADVLLFVPTYNEAPNVRELARRVLALGLDLDLLFLDDNSPDGTGAILDEMSRENSRIHVLHRPAKLGIGSAHQAGIRCAYQQGYKLLITMDCDFTHQPEDIPRLIAAAGNADLVVASRHLAPESLHGWQPHRIFLTKLAYFLTRWWLRMPFDATGAFRLYRLDRIPQTLFDKVISRSYPFFLESLYILWASGVRVEQIPVCLNARAQGRSKMRVSDAWQSLVTLLRLVFKGPRPASAGRFGRF